jgi:hypothetical protein
VDHTVAGMTYYTTIAFCTTAAFVISIIALLMSSPMMWHKVHLWNFSVLQTVNIPHLIFYPTGLY